MKVGPSTYSLLTGRNANKIEIKWSFLPSVSNSHFRLVLENRLKIEANYPNYNSAYLLMKLLL